MKLIFAVLITANTLVYSQRTGLTPEAQAFFRQRHTEMTADYQQRIRLLDLIKFINQTPRQHTIPLTTDRNLPYVRQWTTNEGKTYKEEVVYGNDGNVYVVTYFLANEYSKTWQRTKAFKADPDKALSHVAESRLNERVATEQARRDAIAEAAELARILNDRDAAAKMARKLDEIKKAIQDVERATQDLEYKLRQ